MKTLGINSNPLVNTYSYHAFVNAIIDNKKILRIRYNNNKKFIWNVISYDTTVELYNDLLLVKEKDKCINREGIIYRNCNKKDELIIEILEKDDSAEHPIINLFVSGDDPKKCLEENNDVIRFGIHRYGIMITENEKIHADVPIDFKVTRWFKLTFKNNSIKASVSSGRSGWQQIIVVDINFICTTIGINYNNLGSSENGSDYDKWLFMNYMQLSYTTDETKSIWLDYCMPANKNYRFEPLFSYLFLDIQYFSINEINDSYKSMNKFLDLCLEHGYYISMSLDEFYIPQRKAYQTFHFFHSNLIYGYDKENSEYMIMGYADKLVCGTVPLNEICKAGLENNSEIIRYKKNYDIYGNKFNIKEFTELVLDYINGINPYDRFNHLQNSFTNKYGLKIFDELLGTECGNDLLLSDIRISYLLYEHSKIMKRRLEFLVENKYIEQTCDNNELYELCTNMVNAARTVNILVLKNNSKSMDTKVIFDQLNNLKKIETEFYERLLKILI